MIYRYDVIFNGYGVIKMDRGYFEEVRAMELCNTMPEYETLKDLLGNEFRIIKPTKLEIGSYCENYRDYNQIMYWYDRMIKFQKQEIAAGRLEKIDF